MLTSKADLHSFDRLCGTCHLCTANSKGVYTFSGDLASSYDLVKELISLIHSETPYHCIGPEIHKNADIRVMDDQDDLVCRIEAKMLNDKPFMKVHSFLPGHDLFPKETIVVDLPKLNHYIDRTHQEKGIPTFIVWYLGRRCPDVGGITVFQNVSILEQIKKQKGNGRFFERKTGRGDFVNGQKLGITGKYHFSICECRPIEELTREILHL